MKRTRLSVADLLGTATLGPRSRPLRSVLSMLGVAIGIATLVTVMGIAGTNQAYTRAQLEALGSNVLEVAPGDGPDGPVPLPDTASAMIRRIGPVEGAAAIRELPDLGVYRTDLVPATMGNGLTVAAVEPELAGAMDLSVVEGRWFDDATSALPGVVLGAKAAQRLGVSAVGQRVWIGNAWYGVMGVMAPSQLAPQLDLKALIGDRWAAEHAADPRITTIYVRSRSGSVPQVRPVIPFTANPAAPFAVQVTAPSRLEQAQTAVDGSYRSLALGLATIALLVGAIGIVNTMVIAVLERRGEIGLRRAVGARAGQVRLQFIIEAALLGLVGGATGVVVGVLVTLMYGAVNAMTPQLDPAACAVGLVLAVLVGAAAGAYPASRAARLSPTQALRGA
ncbi:ABC transporter permease [Cellulomonas sp. URHB0016]